MSDVQQFENQLRAAMTVAIELGWGISPGLTLDGDEGCCCPIGALEIERYSLHPEDIELPEEDGYDYQDRWLEVANTHTDLDEAEATSFVYGFDGTARTETCDLREPFYALGEKLRDEWAGLEGATS